MRLRRSVGVIAVAVGCVLAGYAIGYAKQQPQPGFWYISQYQVDWRMADSLQKLLRAYTIPIADEAKKAGNLLDDKWLIHHTGTEYNVMHLRHMRTWEALNNDTTVRVATRRLFPDSVQRATFSRAFTGIFQGGGHRDAIYIPVVR
jgi:hypothetical protein